MKFFRCPYLAGFVKLTDERERHIAEGHPDLLPDHLPAIEETLADPDEIRRFASRGIWDLVDEGTAVFSRQYADPLGIVVVIVILDLFDAPWIITAYATHNAPQGEKVYERSPAEATSTPDEPWVGYEDDAEPCAHDDVQDEDWPVDEEEAWACDEDDLAWTGDDEEDAAEWPADEELEMAWLDNIDDDELGAYDESENSSASDEVDP